MPSLPAERDATGLPVGFSRELDVELPRKLYANWIPEKGERALRRALTDPERGRLEARAAALDLCLQPFGEQDIAAVEAEIAAMFSGFRSMRQQGEDVEATVGVTSRVLREFPLWAIAKACLLIAQNKAEVEGKRLDRRFAPNDSEIYAVVHGVVQLRRDALKSARTLLSAPVEEPAPPKGNSDHPIIARPARPMQPQYEPVRPGYAQRVAEDMERRRRAREEATGPPTDTAA